MTKHKFTHMSQKQISSRLYGCFKTHLSQQKLFALVNMVTLFHKTVKMSVNFFLSMLKTFKYLHSNVQFLLNIKMS